MIKSEKLIALENAFKSLDRYKELKKLSRAIYNELAEEKVQCELLHIRRRGRLILIKIRKK